MVIVDDISLTEIALLMTILRYLSNQKEAVTGKCQLNFKRNELHQKQSIRI